MLTHKGTTPLKTNRLVLRRFVQEDEEMVFNNMTSDHRMTKYLAWERTNSRTKPIFWFNGDIKEYGMLRDSWFNR